MKLTRNNSSASKITWSYALILAFITIFMGLALTLVVGYQLAESKIQDANGLMTSLQRSFIDDRPDWNQWRETSNLNTSDTFVRVSFEKNKQKHVYYSDEAQKFINAKAKKVPFYPDLEIRDYWRPYYHLTSVNKGIHYEIWVGFHNVTHIFKLIFNTLLIVMLISFLFGVWMISILAKRLNRPLVNLTRSTHEINRRSDLKNDTQLPVPDNPQEVHDLSLEFNRLLSQLNRQMERDQQFVSDASHELRTPITAIRGHVEFIKRHGKTNPEIIPRSLGFIDSESLRMQKLIESLLRLSRMDKMQVVKEPVNLSAVLTKLLASYEETIPQKLVLTIGTDISTQINPDSFEQIVVALLNNASKYSPKESIITVELLQMKEAVILTIMDQGIGIPAAEKTKIFDRFYRVDKARTQQIPGTGLGLAIVKELADLNDIKIKVADNLPQGTKFILKINE